MLTEHYGAYKKSTFNGKWPKNLKIQTCRKYITNFIQ